MNIDFHKNACTKFALLVATFSCVILLRFQTRLLLFNCGTDVSRSIKGVVRADDWWVSLQYYLDDRGTSGKICLCSTPIMTVITSKILLLMYYCSTIILLILWMYHMKALGEKGVTLISSKNTRVQFFVLRGRCHIAMTLLFSEIIDNTYE